MAGVGIHKWNAVGIHKWNAVGIKKGEEPVSGHQTQPEHGDEQADAGRDCRTRLARPKSQARTRTGKTSFSLFS